MSGTINQLLLPYLQALWAQRQRAAAGLPLQQPAPGDWTDRLPPAYSGADPRMVAQPYADPGYAMPNVDIGNLNQSSGQEVQGWLPANVLWPYRTNPSPRNT